MEVGGVQARLASIIHFAESSVPSVESKQITVEREHVAD